MTTTREKLESEGQGEDFYVFKAAATRERERERKGEREAKKITEIKETRSCELSPFHPSNDVFPLLLYIWLPLLGV